jgi:hypothetical protein
MYSGSAERHRNDIIVASSKTLETVCKLDIRSTLPELQHDFCGLWNQVVDTVQTYSPPYHVFIAVTTLKNIRKLYITLHEYSFTPPTAFYNLLRRMIGIWFWITPDHILCALLMIIVLPCQFWTCNLTSRYLMHLKMAIPSLASRLCPPPLSPTH